MPKKVDGARVIVQVSRIPCDEGGPRSRLTASEYATYLVGDGKGEDAELPEMFTRDENIPEVFARRWLRRDRASDVGQPRKLTLVQAYCAHLLREELPLEHRHFRAAISFVPQDSARLDLVEFTRELIERVEDDHSVRTQRRLNWVGAAHYNTEHSHVHVGIRGLDSAWEPFDLAPDYMNKGLRWRANALVAEVLGSARGRAGNTAKVIHD